ncbi:MAG: hypothetical protein MUE85_09360 [Microscillaceae bacterium]|jgi:hypothetical protein|nr:hypothetical protein [Microscillaceae bacterium]
MPENLIKFQEVRDFGGILNTTFAFLRENLQSLALTILTYGIPFIVVSAILYGSLPMLLTSPSTMLIYMLILVLISVVYGTALITLTYQYIILYIERGGGNFSPQDVWQSSLKNIGMIFTTFLGYMLLVGIGSVLLLLPGIYWAVCFAMVFIVRLNEGKDFSEARQRCIELLKGNTGSIWNNWFKLLGLMFVAGIISLIVGYVAKLPFQMMGLDVTKLLINNVGTYSPTLVLAALIDILISSLTQTISVIALCLQYFSLVEERDSVDLRNQIDTFGENV